MKPSDPPAFDVVSLAAHDVDACLALSTAAGWNQTRRDWEFHLRLGEGTGLRTASGRLIATGIVLPAELEVGWIAMVLVAEDFRRQGLGRKVMRLLMDESSFPGLALDATEQGLPLYESLGFCAFERIVRHRLRRQGDQSHVDAWEEEVRGDLPFGAIPRALAGRPDVSCVTHDGATALIRPGRTALHVGPLAADSEASAAALVRLVLEKTTGDVLLDVPVRAASFTRRVERFGFAAERIFVRMGRRTGFFVEPGTFAIAGPEYG